MKIIALEGLDGAGKTTLFERLKRSKGLPKCVFTGELQSEIGYLLKTKREWLADPLIKLHAFAADRAVTYSLLSKSSASGSIVVWDRYLYSALAYREAELRLGRSSLGLAEATQVNRTFPQAALIIYLEVPIECAIARKGGDPALLEQVDQCYKELLDSMGVPYRKVNGTGSPEAVAADVEGAINDAIADLEE
ncbi:MULTISPECIES: dTMP kinase [unclassified Bradyrhizobium]|uniref:dTMP kinase n=1 Tax=unclassified Bradyrhizobium TaxID=2631580 RepID=UPI0028EC51EC|nr:MULTISPECIES: dTMP kinase [unclassified Bradyrhizobium]